MRTLRQPGPVGHPRIDIGPAEGTPIEMTLAAGIPLEEAVAQATAGYDSAWLELWDAQVAGLRYVVPDHAPDETHVAWYSETHGFDGPGSIQHLGMIVGRHDGQSFLHGHGLWTPEGGAQVMGHILAPQTVLAAPVVARGIGLRGAKFDHLPDPETNFELFQIAPGQGGAGFAAVRLRPNQDFAIGLDAACAALGWPAARVHGLGSLIGARFEDDAVMESHATEFLITEATAGLGRTPEIMIVGIGGDQILSGRLIRGENPVLITAELILERLDGP